MNACATTIRIQLASNRDRAGQLTVLDEGGRTILGPIEVSARAADSIAAENGNPFREPVLPFGDPPTGVYEAVDAVETGADTRFRADLYGSHGAIVLSPLSGDAALADACGRFQILIHGGHLSADGRLRVSSGHFRVSDNDLARLLVLVWASERPLRVECREDLSAADDPGVALEELTADAETAHVKSVSVRPAPAPAIWGVRQFVAFGEYSPGEPDPANIGAGQVEIDHDEPPDSIAAQIGAQVVDSARELGLTTLNTYGGSPVPEAGIEWAQTGAQLAGGISGAAELYNNGQTDAAVDALKTTIEAVIPDAVATGVAVAAAPTLLEAAVAITVGAAAAGVTLSVAGIVVTSVVVTVGIGAAVALGTQKLTEVGLHIIDEHYNP
jgi:hypothetical protein